MLRSATRQNRTIRSIVLASIACLLALIASADASTYFIAANGSDGNSGRSPAAPFLTIAKINGLSLRPGDSVLFRRGDVFFGEIAARAGAPGAPVVYGAYGEGHDPVICGATRLPSAGWQRNADASWSRDGIALTAMTAADPPSLFFNGALLTPARSPNSGFFTAQLVEGANPGSHCCEYSLAFRDSTLPAAFPNASDLVGGNVTAYDQYGISTRLVTGYDPSTGRVTMDTLRGAAFLGYKLYFLSCRRGFLDAPGEWHYDEQATRLTVRFPGDTAPGPGDTLCASAIDFGVNAWQTGYIRIQDLDFRYQKIAGVWIIRADSVTVDRCAFTGMRHGVDIWGSGGPPEVRVRHARVLDCAFRGVLRTGIDARNLEECTLAGNTFVDIGPANGSGQSGHADRWKGYGYYEYGIGIQASGVNSIIEGNTVLRSGRQGITAGGQGVLVRFNTVDHACLSYNDCGAFMPLGDSRTEFNIVRHSIGPYDQFAGSGARGIYPDFRERDTIRFNTIVDARVGIGLTNAKREVVRGNIVYGSTAMAFSMNKKNAGPLDNTVVGNTFFGLDARQYSLRWENQVTEPDRSVIDSNRYWNPYTDFPVVKHKRDSASAEAWWDFAGWTGTGNDRHATRNFLTAPPPWRILDTTGASLVLNGSFESGTAGWSFSDSLTAVPGVLDGRCARLKKNSTGSKTFWTRLTMPLDTGFAYVVRFTVADPSNIGRTTLRVREDAAAWNVWLERVYLTKAARREYWTVFSPPASGRALLEFSSSNSQYWLDNISVLPVHALPTDPGERFPIFVNDTRHPKTFDLGERCYLDLDSVPVRGSLTLAPFTSSILVLRDTCALTSVPRNSAPAAPEVDVYPNPMRSGGGVLTVRADAGAAVRVTILDALGRPSFAADLGDGARQRTLILPPDLPAGAYRAVVTAGASSTSAPFIVLGTR
ncbi:MAG: right-handed parallel beta-helix repeat-containing protein [Ignavibacteria bacterium]|nr:right-handed parallel beta-helix repeat-containing protein [Ignavibacteria bacterium]